jgi:hypothetical protein
MPVSARASKVALILILLVAAGRVASTWSVFSQTFDEGTHIAAGMEWLERGTYLGEPQHPPLARIASALGPFAAGARLTYDDIGLAEQGNEILHSGPYTRMLSLARAGILPFFLLSIVVVWGYARELGGNGAAIAAALLYSNLPPVLAHAGLATTDMAVTAGVAATLMLLHRWLRTPTRGGAVLLGLAAALAVTSKFSSLLFIPVAALVVLALERRWSRRHLGQAALALAVCTLAMWGVYRFRLEPLRGSNHDLVAGYSEALAARLDGIPLPMPELVSGIAQMLIHNADGHESYLLGVYSIRGWWYYFPVAIAVKTTIVFLLLALASVVVLARDTRRRALLAPFLGAAAIVVACMPANINIGIRHVLPIYPLLAVSAGCALALVWQRGRAGRAVVAIALAAELFVSARAHPDYLAYFNAFAGDAPEKILLDSNLDWGQDLLRLERRARELKMDALRLSYFGTADIERLDLPPLLPVEFEQPSPGWVAVSEGTMGSRLHPRTYPWLARYPMVERVGKSIRLYRIPGTPSRTEITGVMTRILVPLPLGSISGVDRTWTTSLRLQSDAAAPEPALDSRGNRREIAPDAPLLWDAPSGGTAWFLYVRRAAASRIQAQLEVSDSAGGPATVVPAPHEEKFRSWAAMRLNPCGGCTRTLRVYSLDSGPLTITIRFHRDGQTVSHTATLSAKSRGLPAWGQFDLKRIFPGDSGGELSIVGHQHEPLWAFVTAGDAVVTSN